MMKNLDAKMEDLRLTMRGMRSAVIAFSGGADSSLLLKIAVEELGGNALAVTASSKTYPRSELENALQIAKSLSARHLVFESDELDDPLFSSNPPDRCYHCKKHLFGKIRKIASDNKIEWICEAGNLDDLNDYRPGMKALDELNIRRPLIEAGFTKNDVREASRILGLDTWKKPATACLASRFQYGETISSQSLEMLEKAELFLSKYGLAQFRVRIHGKLARIEVEPDEIARISAERENISRALKSFGFTYVSLDLDGYRMGSMNEELPK